MFVSTTNLLDGVTIKQYKGVVFGEVISGVNCFKDMKAGFRNTFGGRSTAYEKELEKAREEAIREMMKKAQDIGANAIIGVDVDYEVLGENNGMMMVTVSGTAVVV